MAIFNPMEAATNLALFDISYLCLQRFRGDILGDIESPLKGRPRPELVPPSSLPHRVSEIV